MPQSSNINGIDNSGLPQTTFSLTILLGQDVTLKCSRSYELSRSRSFKAFCRCSVGLYFGHFILHNIRHEPQVSLQSPAPCSLYAFSREDGQILGARPARFRYLQGYSALESNATANDPTWLDCKLKDEIY